MSRSTADQAPYWRPAPDTVLQAERALLPFLQATEASAKDAFIRDAAKQVMTDFASYRRQYYGMTDKGRRLVALNALCIDLPGWRTNRAVVLDGGPCFFTAAYDPATGRFEAFAPNGFG